MEFTYDLDPEPEFAVLDTETTGFLPSTDRIVEIAVVRLRRRSEPEVRFDSLVNPGRDVGPTRVHGITASMVAHAPRFEDVAGSVAEALSGAILVGHNVAFDARFLRREYDRVGVELPELQPVCTLELSRRVLRKAPGHRLSWLCEHLGLATETAHRAKSDALATARLLDVLLERAKEEPLARLDVQARLRSADVLGELARNLSRARSMMLRREDSGGWVKDGGKAFLQRLLRHTAPPEHAPGPEQPNIDLYLSLLDLMLEDRLLDDGEQERLEKVVEEWSISEAVVRRAHELYIEWLVDAALLDREITEPERADLRQVAEALAISPLRLEELLAAGQKRSDGAAPLEQKITRHYLARGHALRGKTVCFTGAFAGPKGGGCSREEVEKLAREHGLEVAKGVTKKLDLLVVADPSTQSGKASKARDYGVTIQAEHVFWRELGLA